MVERSPATVTKPVRALGAAVHDLTTERHEPDKPRGLRPDLWGTAGEIPAVYPAVKVEQEPAHVDRAGQTRDETAHLLLAANLVRWSYADLRIPQQSVHLVLLFVIVHRAKFCECGLQEG